MPILKPFDPLHYPALVKLAASYTHSGKLRVSSNHLVYIDLMDDYIHQLSPLLQQDNAAIEKPAYFKQGGIGAHITVIYPEENVRIPPEELEKKYAFDITGVYTAHLGSKHYFVLGVSCPPLIHLRKRYGLGPKLLFKESWIDLHITIGVLPDQSTKRP